LLPPANLGLGARNGLWLSLRMWLMRGKHAERDCREESGSNVQHLGQILRRRVCREDGPGRSPFLCGFSEKSRRTSSGNWLRDRAGASSRCAPRDRNSRGGQFVADAGRPKSPLEAGTPRSSPERAASSRRHAPIPAEEEISPGDHAVSPVAAYARLLKNLGQIRQVINVYSAKRASKPGAEQVVLTKRDETQEKLIEILGLPSQKNAV
jgi:hypothetical protein